MREVGDAGGRGCGEGEMVKGLTAGGEEARGAARRPARVCRSDSLSVNPFLPEAVIAVCRT